MRPSGYSSPAFTPCGRSRQPWRPTPAGAPPATPPLAARGAVQRVDFQLGRLLPLLFARRLHRRLGFSSAARYAEERLGLSPRKARALVALERRSAPLPALAAAYRRGEVSWLRAFSL